MTDNAQGNFNFGTDGMHLWTSEDPYLYTMETICGDAVLRRKFGICKLVSDGTHFKLNGKPVLAKICLGAGQRELSREYGISRYAKKVG